MASSYPTPRRFPAQMTLPSSPSPHPHPPQALLPATPPTEEVHPETTYRLPRRFATRHPKDSFESHYGCKRIQAPLCYPAAAPITSSTPEPTQTEDRPLIGFELHYGRRRITPAHAYPPNPTIDAGRSLLPALPISKKSNLVGFEAHYGRKRVKAPECYPAAPELESEDEGETWQPWAKHQVQIDTDTGAVKGLDEEEGGRELVGFEVHYRRRRVKAADVYPPKDEMKHSVDALLPDMPVSAGDKEERHEESESEIDEHAECYSTPRTLHFSNSGVCPDCNKPINSSTVPPPRTFLNNLTPTAEKPTPKKTTPVILTLTSLPRPGITTEQYHRYLTTVHAPLAAPVLKKHGAFKYTISHCLTPLKDRLLPLFGGSSEKEEDEDWEHIENEEKEEKKRENNLQTTEVVVQIWFEGEEDVRRLVRDEEWTGMVQGDAARFADVAETRVTVGWGEVVF